MVLGKTRKESLWLNRDVLCVRLKRAVQGKVTKNSGSSLGFPSASQNLGCVLGEDWVVAPVPGWQCLAKVETLCHCR